LNVPIRLLNSSFLPIAGTAWAKGQVLNKNQRMTAQLNVNLWSSPGHALEYLRKADSIPHRVEGESALLEFLPRDAKRILDLGSGAGRLLSLVKIARPGGAIRSGRFLGTHVKRAAH
jgi:hypothetical protein